MSFSTQSDIVNWAKTEARMCPRRVLSAAGATDRMASPEDTYSDTELVYRLLVNQTPVPYHKRGEARFEQVCRAFSVMEGSARKICTRHGFDPDERVRKR